METLRYDDDGAPYDVADVPGYFDTVGFCGDCYGFVHYGWNDPHTVYAAGYAGPDVITARLSAAGIAQAIYDGARREYDPTTGQAIAREHYTADLCGGCGGGDYGVRIDVDVLAA